jgi:hypothetical protein
MKCTGENAWEGWHREQHEMGRKQTGKWRIEEDQLCIEFDEDPPAKCNGVGMSEKKSDSDAKA